MTALREGFERFEREAEHLEHLIPAELDRIDAARYPPRRLREALEPTSPPLPTQTV
jgi:hypothetical protein